MTGVQTCALPISTDGSGNLIVGDFFNQRVRLVAVGTGTFYGQAMTKGDIYTVAGGGTGLLCCNGLPATAGQFPGLAAVTTDQAGNMIIGVSSEVEVAAAASGTFYGQHMTAGDLYDIAGNNTFGFSGDGGPATSAAMEDPGGLAVDAAGNVILADALINRVRLVAVSTGTFYGQAMTAGDIYTIAGGGTGGLGDGGPATSAELNEPAGVTVDSVGNLVITDTFDLRIRVVAARTGTFYGQAMTAGDIYTIAGDGTAGDSGDGGPATSAELSYPAGVAVDGAGNVVLTDLVDAQVQVVAASTGTFYGQAMTAGDIYTIAGNGTHGGSGDGGPGTGAELDHPVGVTVTSAGNVLVADLANEDEGPSRVRMIQG